MAGASEGGVHRAKDTDEATSLPGGFSQPTALVQLRTSLLHDRSPLCSCKHRENDENMTNEHCENKHVS